MRNIVTNIKSLLEFDKDRLRESILKTAIDFTRLEYDTIKLRSDNVLRKTNQQNAESAYNRLRVISSQIRGMKSRELADQKQIDMYLVEIYKKYSIPFACIVFVLIGAPLGVMTRKGSFGIAAGMSLGFFLLYWACLIGGEKLADREFVSPFISMWFANIIIGITGVYLTLKQSLNFSYNKLLLIFKK
jgi:lipopolysaccharide export LptBFGC system permease protein LptF